MLILRLCDALLQDIVSILGQLKTDIKVTEALLRVSDGERSSQWNLSRIVMLLSMLRKHGWAPPSANFASMKAKLSFL